MSPRRGFPRQRDLRRRPPRLTPRHTVLIVCEGRRTEPNYFEDMRKALHLKTTEVRVLKGKGTGGAEQLVRKAKRAKREEDFDDVWCVFGCDQCANFDDAVGLCASKRDAVGAAASNPCVELWFLLHFEYTSAPLSTREVQRRLAAHIPGYDKSSTPVYSLLEDRQPAAIANAERLRSYHSDAGNKETETPSTRMHVLVQSLTRLTED